MTKEKLEEWAKKNSTELMKIVKVLDVAFKYVGHHYILGHVECVKLATAHGKLKPLTLVPLILASCPKCEKPREMEEKSKGFTGKCPHCGDEAPF